LFSSSEDRDFSSRQKRKLAQLRQTTVTTFNNLRITFYLDALYDDKALLRSCTKEGEYVAMGIPPTNNVYCGQKDASGYLISDNCWELCKANMVITNEKIEYMKNTVIPKLKDEYESLLQVRRTGADYSFNNTVCQDDRRALYYLPDDLLTNGLRANETDLAILVYMRPRRSGSGISGGYAFHCKAEPVFGRPVLGILNLHPVNVLNDDTNYRIVRHELMHVLAFSPALYDSFVDETGVKRTSPTIVIQKSITGYDSNIVLTENLRLVTPRVTQYVKDHFNCSEATGADLEEYGSPATSSAHWEMRLFMNEMMTGSSDYLAFTSYYAFSKLTLALLEDSGWYNVTDWSKAEVMTWGRNTGCTMTDPTKRCEHWNNYMTHVGYSCGLKDVSANFCTSDLTSVGVCNIVSYTSPLPTQYQHFEKTSLGGRSALTDYCPMIQRSKALNASDDLDCRNPNNIKTRVEGEYFGEKSACFHSNVASRIFVNQGDFGQDARCYRYKCDNNRLSIVLAGLTIQCPEDQSYKRITTGLPIGYAGYVDCPNDGYDLLCGDERVPDIRLKATDPVASNAPQLAHSIFLLLVLVSTLLVL